MVEFTRNERGRFGLGGILGYAVASPGGTSVALAVEYYANASDEAAARRTHVQFQMTPNVARAIAHALERTAGAAEAPPGPRTRPN